MHIPMSFPDVDEADVQAVVDVVRSGRLVLGSRIVTFEERIAAHVGARNPRPSPWRSAR